MTVSYHKVRGCLWVFMSEVNRINSECLLELKFILYPEKTKLNHVTNQHASFTLTLDLLVFNFRPTFIDIYFCRGEIRLQCSYSPESCAVKMDHHPLGCVEDKRVSKFNAFQGPAKLRTEVGWASVRSINMEPQSFFCTCKKRFKYKYCNSANASHGRTQCFDFITDIIESKFEDLQTGPSSESLSKAHTPVDPKVAHSWTGEEHKHR